MSTDPLAAAREAFARNAWSEAHEALVKAREIAPLGLDDLERLAMSAYLTGREEAGAGWWAEAHTECLRRQDVPRATRCGFWLVLDLITRGELAQANGWLARTHRLLDDSGCDCAERGLLLAIVARRYIKAGDLSAALDTASRAVDLAARFEDPDVRVFSRLSLAQVRARQGHISEAATLFDEIMVAVTMGDVSPVAVGVAYCAVIDGCVDLFDVGRAREWTSALARWCGTLPDLVPFRGTCLVHRAEVLRLAGAWPEAMTEAEHACRWMTEAIDRLEAPASVRALPSFKFPVGPAFYELGEIHRLRGNFEEAEAAYKQASQYGRAPQPGLARLRLAQGRNDAAAASVRRGLQEALNRPQRAEMLAASVEVMIAVADLAAARAAAEELTVMAGACRAPFLQALAAQALASVLLAEGDAPAAIAPLRAAWMGWQEIDAPWQAAQVRVLRALACRALGDEDTAVLELDAAHRIFLRLEAAPDLARIETLRGSAPDGGALTRRERQVLSLIATGKTNRAIAEELAISDRTVDRHVSNILTKLDLPSRAAATAYACQHGLLTSRT